MTTPPPPPPPEAEVQSPVVDHQFDDVEGDAEPVYGIELVNGDALAEEEVEAPPPPVAKETPAEKALRLKELRKADGSFDEDLIESTLNTAAQSADEAAAAQHLYATDAAFRLAYIKARVEKGWPIRDDQRAILAASQKPATPTPTQEQIDAEYQRRYTTMGEAAAMRFWHENVTRPENEKIRAEMAADKAEREAAAAVAREQAATAASAQQYRSEGAAAFKAYGSNLLVKDGSMFGYKITDKAVSDKVLELAKAGYDAPLAELIDTALFKLKRHQGTRTAKAATQPAVRAVKVPPAKKVVNPQYDDVD